MPFSPVNVGLCLRQRAGTNQIHPPLVTMRDDHTLSRDKAPIGVSLLTQDCTPQRQINRTPESCLRFSGLQREFRTGVEETHP